MRLQINPTNWKDLDHDRQTRRRTVKTGAAIYEANRFAAAKVKSEARKSQVCSLRNADAQPLPTCPRCQRTFRARKGLIGHLRINCASRTAPTVVPTLAYSSSSPPPTKSDCPCEPPLLLLLPPLLRPPSLPPPHAPLPQRRPFWRLSRTPAPHTSRHPPPIEVRNKTAPALTETAPPPHTSAGSVTCESIAQRPTNQCLEYQPTPTALASTADTALAPLRIAWVSSATCASTTTCGRQPPAAHTITPSLTASAPPTPPNHTSTLTHRKHSNAPPRQVESVHLDSVSMRLWLHG
nr:unnamed protein product [Spirometra erinaceieuropaei]